MLYVVFDLGIGTDRRSSRDGTPDVLKNQKPTLNCLTHKDLQAIALDLNIGRADLSRQDTPVKIFENFFVYIK